MSMSEILFLKAGPVANDLLDLRYGRKQYLLRRLASYAKVS